MNEIERILRGYEMPLCQFCGKDTKHGKGTGKRATHNTGEGDSVCEECCKGYELHMTFAGHYESELDAYLAGRPVDPEIVAMFEEWWRERES